MFIVWHTLSSVFMEKREERKTEKKTAKATAQLFFSAQITSEWLGFSFWKKDLFSSFCSPLRCRHQFSLNNIFCTVLPVIIHFSCNKCLCAYKIIPLLISKVKGLNCGILFFFCLKTILFKKKSNLPVFSFLLPTVL